MQVLALYHMKGGVGKTAAAVNLAYLAAQSGARTLLCDLDPQASATYYFRIQPKLKAKQKVFARGGKHLEKSIKATDFAHLDLLPGALSHRHLTEVFQQAKHPARCLHRSLAALRDEYQYVILDCPSGVSLMAQNVFYAADYVLIPVVPSPLSVHAYQQLRTFYTKHGYDLNKLRTFFSMVERQKKLHQSVMRELTASHPEALPQAIPYLVDVENMGIHREPVLVSVPHSRASQAYEQLWTAMEALLNQAHPGSPPAPADLADLVDLADRQSQPDQNRSRAESSDQSPQSTSETLPQPAVAVSAALKSAK